MNRRSCRWRQSGCLASPRYDERGSGTLLVASLALLLLMAGLLGVLWAAVSTGHHRAAAAADLSALSAAEALRAGAGDPCSTASRIAVEQRADVLDCRVEGDTVVVIAAVRLRLGALGSPSMRSVARAGPVGSVSVGLGSMDVGTVPEFSGGGRRAADWEDGG